jgi:hypothetical protein
MHPTISYSFLALALKVEAFTMCANTA